MGNHLLPDKWQSLREGHRWSYLVEGFGKRLERFIYLGGDLFVYLFGGDLFIYLFTYLSRRRWQPLTTYLGEDGHQSTYLGKDSQLSIYLAKSYLSIYVPS